MLHLSTPPACCHGDGLQGQQWGGSSFGVCLCVHARVCLSEFVRDCELNMFFYDTMRNMERADMRVRVSVCGYACMHMCVSGPRQMLMHLCMLTFVVGGVVDAEISVPDDGQLHGKTAHLHPIIEILSP